MHRVSCPALDREALYCHGGAKVVGLPSVLDFSVSVNPLGPPASVLQAIRRRLPAIERYPDPYCQSLAEKLAHCHRLSSKHVLIGNGSNELIHLICRALQPKRVAIVEPTYTEYLRAATLVGAEVDHWLPVGGDFCPRPFDPDGAAIVWVCNPNNPTGHLWECGRLADWIASHPQKVFVVDEAFMPFCDGQTGRKCQRRGNEMSLIPLLERFDNLIVLRSMTKVYAFPGLRLGYLATSPELAGRLRTHLIPWSVNSLAEAAGLAALDDPTYLERTRFWLMQARAVFLKDVRDLEPVLVPLPTQGNFVLVRLSGISGTWLTERLLECGLAVRNASNFVGLDDSYVRIGLHLPARNQRLVEALRTVLHERGVARCRAH